MSDPLPTEIEQLLAELAALSSFTIGERTPRDWPAVEAAMGVPLPSQYKALAETFPVGAFGHLVIYHPARSDTPPWRKPDGLVEAARDMGPRMDPQTEAAVYHGYPEPGGLIPWADCNGDEFLCWLPNDEDPDRWPVVAFDAEGDDTSEVVEGSTLQALIRVLRGEAGRSVFPPYFYEEPPEFGEALPQYE